jgi:hypothetical protein
MARRRITAAQNPLVALAERSASALHAILVVQDADGSISFHALPQTSNAVTQAGLLAHALRLSTEDESAPAPEEE